MLKPRFLTTEEIIRIHDNAIAEDGGISGLRDLKLLESSSGLPQASFNGHLLMDIFEMAAAYAISITLNHPFHDGNKRTAAVSATIFLFYNGYYLFENDEVELADKILEIISHKIDKKNLANYFKLNCQKIK